MDATYDYPEELVKGFVVAAHQDLATVKQMLADNPGLLNVNYKWGEGNYETPIGAAGHMGRADIAEYLLSQGASLNICVAAVLRRETEVEEMLAREPQLAGSSGAHNIPLLVHVALGGSPRIAAAVCERSEPAQDLLNAALHVAAARGHADLAGWLLQNTAADVNARNQQEQTPLEVAVKRQDQALIALLQQHGATEPAPTA